MIYHCELELPENYQTVRELPDSQRITRQSEYRHVHCGFCLATCPTYQLTGNELDSPRGRIYLIKSALEGNNFDHASIHLSESDPSVIVTANIGCLMHLSKGTKIPVKHWVELLDS